MAKAKHDPSNQPSIPTNSDIGDTSESIMPPATTMAENNSDPFGQFGQLSLDNSSAATPTKQTQTTDYQYAQQTQQQQQQQPMQVSPEQPQQQMHHPQAGYGNYQYNAFGQQPNQPMNLPMQQQQPPHFGQPQQAMQMPSQAPLMSPPISPLCTPASPDASPPINQDFSMQQAAASANENIGPMLTLPTEFAHAQPMAGAPVPTLSPSSPNPGAAAANPFDVFAAPVQAPVPPIANDPFGSNMAPAQAPLAQQTVPPQQQQQQQQPVQPQADEADFWNNMGFGAPSANNSNSANDSIGNVTPTGSDASLSSVSTNNDSNANADQDHSLDSTPVTLDERGLPAGGEYYKARVTTPMLGAIFSSGKELRSTLYKTASNSYVEAIGDRPVISFTIDGSAADTAGIGLGHVLLKVNDIEVHQTDEAVKTVGAAARPMTMEFYVPNKEVKVVKTEGHCMVKYDNHSTEAPASCIEWKAKYVVVGDMLGKPHILYMYRSKGEYDIAVKESQTRARTLSVKVKQFDIRGAKIFHERGTVRYPNKPKWHYFTVVRGTGLPIKISASSAEELAPVYEGIVGFLDREARMKKMRMEQNRERMHMQGMYRETYY